MNLAVCGPNLRDQTKGGIHVHEAGCRDLKRGRADEPAYADAWLIEADTKMEVVEAIYPPGEFGWDTTDEREVDAYASDVYFFPCCSILPFGSPSGAPVPPDELRQVVECLEELARGGCVLEIDGLERALFEAADAVRTLADVREAAQA